MRSPSLQSLHIYPIKSAAGISLSTSWVDDLGLSLDRRFVITDDSGQFITARTEPTLCLIKVNLSAQGLILTAPDMPALQVLYQELSPIYKKVTVWQDDIQAQYGHQNFDLWFSQYLKKPCQLVYFGNKSQRLVSKSHKKIAFADGYPLLLTSQASLDDLNNRLTQQAIPAITMRQFRPNIVANLCDAYAEDTWQHIRIGEVEFEVTKPCSRCIFTTVNPINAENHPQQEPLTTLINYRQVASGDVMFGQNLIALNQGSITQGDEIVILKKQAPPIFITKPTKTAANKKATAEVSANKEPKKMRKGKVNLSFESWNKNVIGNTKDSILEQGEAAGMLLPYSCRGGMCGRCKIKLIDGDVKQLANDGLSDDEKEQGFVLACSSVPQSDLVLAKK
ncbi:YcbX family protein [Colwellia hornerae]|uniref:MOSC domain-containing protein n=1 Tax=Colwellia hornerae TaxID=89402 RepID=A0A5C6QBL2_9GAMM|nr:MOSC N-terminal beta barrel domain-containing protein [Colwellia hornerae]TWX52992.1 MOSC domain-containing protein [Colwellia hornerae]TWX59255.1 MOSC domain-containing protein [Colwellia hornerae]TWX66141.1 MOSC domain-containing protein [Colwellia hornerae]